MYPAYNNQFYMQDLQNTRDRIDRQLQQMQQMQQQGPQQPAPITQNFQIAPTQGVSGIKYANSKDEVSRELVFGDTIFVNKDYTTMWLKNVRGETKEYGLVEVIELDPKDAEIKSLKAQIEELKKGGEYKNEPSDEYVNEPTKKSKSSGLSISSSSKK